MRRHGNLPPLEILISGPSIIGGVASCRITRERRVSDNRGIMAFGGGSYGTQCESLSAAEEENDAIGRN